MKWSCTIALLISCTALFAQKNSLISRLSTEVKLVSPPEVEYRRASEWSPKVHPVNRWLMIKTEFTVKKEQAAPRYRSGKMVFSGFADNVSLSVRVLFDTGFKTGGRSIHCLYTGSTEFYALRCDGKKHLAVMFIPAGLIDRFSQSADGSVRRAGEKDFKVEAVISRNGKVLDRAWCNVSGSAAFDSECRAVTDNLRVVDGVFPRSRTPWALFGTEDLDIEKELFRR